MLIAVDFDGTIVKHKFPEIGDVVPEALEWIKKFKEAGATLFLYTMRSDNEKFGEYLTDAIEYCRDNGVEFDGINTNPYQYTWTTSPKCYAHLYIDDAAFGCPLVFENGERPYVDWSVVGPRVLEMVKREKNVS